MSKNPELLLTRINLAAQGYSLGSGAPGLTRNDILAALGMAHLDRPVWCMIQMYYLRDNSVCSELSKHLWLKAVDLAIENGWVTPTGRELLRKMAVLALYELVKPTVCRRCKNKDDEVEDCKVCKGKGHVLMSDRRRADHVGLSKSSWSDLWRFRYKEIQKVAKTWLADAEGFMSEQASDLNDIEAGAPGGSGSSVPGKPWNWNGKNSAQVKQDNRKAESGSKKNNLKRVA